MLLGVDPLEAGAEHRAAFPAGFERPAMRRRVDSAREAAHHGDTLLRQGAREPVRHVVSCGILGGHRRARLRRRTKRRMESFPLRRIAECPRRQRHAKAYRHAGYHALSACVDDGILEHLR